MLFRSIAGVDPAEQDAVAIENLTLAAAAAARVGATVLVEAINSVDVPAFPIDSSDAAIAVIDSVLGSVRGAGLGGAAAGNVPGGAAAGNVAFLADLYHLGMMGEDLSATLTKYRDRIAHVQIADVPGRGAPGTGTLDFAPLFGLLAENGYAGRVGLEYLPADPADPADSSSSFGWL